MSADFFHTKPYSDPGVQTSRPSRQRRPSQRNSQSRLSSIEMAFAWRNIFTYNRYSGIAARAIRRSLKEEQRLAAEKRATSSVRVSKWKDGVQGEQQRLGTAEE